MAENNSNGNGRATIREVYDLIHEMRAEVLTEVKTLAEKVEARHEKLNDRLTKVWIALGSVTTGLSIAGLVLKLTTG